MSSSPSILADKDVNISALNQNNLNSPFDASEKKAAVAADPHSMEYHRQVLQSKLEQNKGGEKYISPSDTIMSPCTAKLSAYRNKQVGKNTKPRSLFAKTSAKNLSAKTNGGDLFGKDIASSNDTSSSDAGDAMQE